jgi:hypothetical protein
MVDKAKHNTIRRNTEAHAEEARRGSTQNRTPMARKGERYTMPDIGTADARGGWKVGTYKKRERAR